MRQNKNAFLDKLIKRNYNNELEKILDEKNLDETAKNALLGILYKIEMAYNDYITVKNNVETKEEYIDNLFDIIQNNCKSIKIVKMNEEENIIPESQTYVIDKEKKEIISYPIERGILYAIAKIEKKEKIIKEDYYVIDRTLSELINIGNDINFVEPLRDFNGYSWTTIPKEIEGIDHNLIYQNLRILVGYSFLDKWVKDNEYIMDYFEAFKNKLESKYKKANQEEFVDILLKISVLLYVINDEEKEDELINQKEKLEKKLNEVSDKEKFIENITQQKNKINKKIRKINDIIADKTLLEQEYYERNEKLPLEKKIFSMKVLKRILEDEANQYIDELVKLNDLMNPENCIEYEEELKNKYKYLEILNSGKYEQELTNLKLELQKMFLKMLKEDILKTESKQEIGDIIYNYRYYLLTQYDENIQVKDVTELQDLINEISKLIIYKAIKLKKIEKVSNDGITNYEILRNIFYVRIINLDDAFLKLTKENDKYFVQIFDENNIEEKAEVNKPKGFTIKLNKKRTIMLH